MIHLESQRRIMDIALFIGDLSICWHFANGQDFRIIQMDFYEWCFTNVFITRVIFALFTVS